MQLEDIVDNCAVSINSKENKSEYFHLPDKEVRFGKINNCVYGAISKHRSSNIFVTE